MNTDLWPSMRKYRLNLAVVFMATLFGPAFVSAHHSGAMFDFEHPITLNGTVKEFQWTNPHCYIQLLVSKDGQFQEWSVELGAPAHLFRSGWRPYSLKSGDKVQLVIAPLRDGSRGGQFKSGVGSGGKEIGTETTQ
jgi:Family of unknown function (DUF6152)